MTTENVQNTMTVWCISPFGGDTGVTEMKRNKLHINQYRYDFFLKMIIRWEHNLYKFSL